MKLNSDFMRLVPEGTTHALVEERQSRGQSVWAVVAIIPQGAAVPLNAYSSESMANEVAQALNSSLAA